MPTTRISGSLSSAARSAVSQGAERHAETADALDQNRVGHGLQLRESGDDVRQLDAPAFLLGGDVRRDRGAEAVGIDQRPRWLERRGGEQALDVVVASRAHRNRRRPVSSPARSARFGARRAAARRRRRSCRFRYRCR
jgi:hypothetical protein